MLSLNRKHSVVGSPILLCSYLLMLFLLINLTPIQETTLSPSLSLSLDDTHRTTLLSSPAAPPSPPSLGTSKTPEPIALSFFMNE
jgi:hypothetical protein